MKHPRIALLAMLAGLTPQAASRLSSAPAAHPARPYDVLHYDAELEPLAASQRLNGRVRIELVSRAARLDAVELDADDLDVAAVSDGSGPARFEVRPGLLRVSLSPPAPLGQQRTLTVRYQALLRHGLRFFPGGWYTAFHTQGWLPCNADPDDKATAILRWIVPAGQVVIGSGQEGPRQPLPADRERRSFTQATPYSAYLLGAVAGPLVSTCGPEDGVEICTWTRANRTGQLQVARATAASAYCFLAARAGVPIPGARYHQVFVPASVAQELAGLSVMDESYLDELATHPHEDWVIVHELAHSWWGNLVTMRSWSDFWLSEGVVTFLVAAYKEQRWGPQDNEHEVALARHRYLKALQEGRDRPLSFDGWVRPSDMGGAMTYSKGALMMDLLRKELGEAGFWAGLRDFTQAGAGKAVTSTDLRMALERASGRDLRNHFSRWVFGTEILPPARGDKEPARATPGSP